MPRRLLAPGSHTQMNFPVAGGATLELTLAQFWSSRGPASLSLEVAFHGLALGGAGSTGNGGAAGIAVDGAAGLQRVMVRVAALIPSVFICFEQQFQDSCCAGLIPSERYRRCSRGWVRCSNRLPAPTHAISNLFTHRNS